MSLFVLDTDLLTLDYRGDPIVVRRVHERPPGELAISILTVDEQLTGWYTLTRQARRPEEIARAYAHLGEAVVRLGHWRIRWLWSGPAPVFAHRAGPFDSISSTAQRHDLVLATLDQRGHMFGPLR